MWRDPLNLPFLSKDLFYLVSPFCALVMTNFLDSRTEIDTIPLTHWKNLGWNWDSLDIPPLNNGHCLQPNRTTPMLKTSPRGYQTPVLQVEIFKPPWIQYERYEAELSLTMLQQNFEIAKGWMQPVSYFLLSTEPPGLWRNVSRSATYTFSVACEPRHTTLLPDSAWLLGLWTHAGA